MGHLGQAPQGKHILPALPRLGKRMAPNAVVVNIATGIGGIYNPNGGVISVSGSQPING